ncbi:hypothetical protein REPUB_Repub11eG0088900 [Reevesia pubescens]
MCLTPIRVTSSQLIASDIFPVPVVKALLFPGAIASNLVKSMTVPSWDNLLNIYNLTSIKEATAVPDFQRLESFENCFQHFFLDYHAQECRLHQTFKISSSSHFDLNRDARSTASTAILVGDRLLVANVGDSRVVIFRGGNVSRAFGDRLLKQYVVADPEIQEEKIDSSLEFLILASDGLWDVISNELSQEVVEMIKPIQDLEQAAKRLMQEAYQIER